MSIILSHLARQSAHCDVDFFMRISDCRYNALSKLSGSGQCWQPRAAAFMDQSTIELDLPIKFWKYERLAPYLSCPKTNCSRLCNTKKMTEKFVSSQAPSQSRRVKMASKSFMLVAISYFLAKTVWWLCMDWSVRLMWMVEWEMQELARTAWPDLEWQFTLKIKVWRPCW